MSQVFGRESAAAHTQTVHRKPARYLVVIDAGGTESWDPMKKDEVARRLARRIADRLAGAA